MDTHYLASIAALLGVFIGWLLRAWTERKQQEQERVLRLFETFYSPEMVASRIRADKYLKRNEEKRRSLTQLGDELPIDEWQDISKVRHFFAHLETLRTHGKLDHDLTCSLFTPHIEFWFDPNRHFAQFESKNDITPHWSATRDGLRAWAIQKFAPSSKFKKR